MINSQLCSEVKLKHVCMMHPTWTRNVVNYKGKREKKERGNGKNIYFLHEEIKEL